MGEPHAHMGESVESLSASSFTLLIQVLRQLCESLRFTANSVFIRRSECTPSSANRGLDSVRISVGERREHGVNIMSVRERHEHGRIA